MKLIEIHFDGGASPNPGKGYGSYEVTGRGDDCCLVPHKVSREVFGDNLTNNQAEYLAMISALKWCDKNLPTHITISMFTDSMLVREQMTANWKSRAPHIKILIAEARSLLKRYRHWKITWNPRKLNVKRFGH